MTARSYESQGPSTGHWTWPREAAITTGEARRSKGPTGKAPETVTCGDSSFSDAPANKHL